MATLADKIRQGGRFMLGGDLERRRGSLLVAAVLLLVISAWRLSLNPSTTGVTTGGEKAQGETVAGPAGDAQAAAEAAAAAASAQSAGGRGRPGGGARGATGSPAGAIKMSKGVTDKTILVGLWYSDLVRGRDTLAGPGFGQTPHFANNERNVMDAIVADVNARGGVAGRQVVPVYYVTNCTECPPEQTAQQMCARYTEDNKVFAISTRQTAHDALVDCAVKTKTVYIHNHIAGQYADKQRYDQIVDYFYWINGMQLERRELAYVDGLFAQNFFSPGARVGIFAQDHPIIRRGVARVLKPLLADRGIQPVSEAYYEAGLQNQQQYQQHVLQFQEARVSHVLLAASNAQWVPTLLFMRAAENQLYRPRYGVATDVDPRILTQFQAPPAQLKGAVGIGWSPRNDPTTTPSEPTTPNDARCREIMRKIGETEISDSSMTGCEGLFFLKHVLDSAKELTPQGFAASVAALGDSYPPVVSMGSRFGPRQHFGPNILRHVAYDESCSCFKYVSGKYVAPGG